MSFFNQNNNAAINKLNTQLAENVKLIKNAWIDVTDKQFGAVGDGVADDTAAINAAITYANSLVAIKGRIALFFPSGTYKVTAQLNQINNFVCVIGAEGNPIIKPTHNGNLFVVQGRGHIFRNIRMQGNNKYASDYASFPNQIGIYNENSPFYECIFDNVYISMGGMAIYAKFNSSSYFYKNKFIDCVFNDNARYGIRLESLDSNNCWIHSNEFHNTDIVSCGYGGVYITGFKSSQNNSYKKLNMDGIGWRYSVETDEKFGIYDDTSSSQYNNLYEQLYFEGLYVPPSHNIDNNNKVGAIILSNFDTVRIMDCVLVSNTRDIMFLTSGGKTGRAEIGSCMNGTNILSSMNKKSPITIKGAGAQTIEVRLNKTYGFGTLSMYDVDSLFVGSILNPYDVKYKYTREDISTTHKVFAVKIASKTTASVYNHSFLCKLTFDHNNSYNQQSLYAEYGVANGSVGLIKSIMSGGGTKTIKFVTDGTNIYLFVGIYGVETYPTLKLYLEGLYNDSNVKSVPASTIVASYASGVPTWQSGVTEITVA